MAATCTEEAGTTVADESTETQNRNMCSDDKGFDIEIDVEYYWQHLPGSLRMLLPSYASQIREINVVELWRQHIDEFPTNKAFDFDFYIKAMSAWDASYILSAYYLLQGKNNEAFYLILYSSLVGEMIDSSPDSVKQFFDLRPHSVGQLARRFGHFVTTIQISQTRSTFVEYAKKRGAGSEVHQAIKYRIRCLTFWANCKARKMNHARYFIRYESVKYATNSY